MQTQPIFKCPGMLPTQHCLVSLFPTFPPSSGCLFIYFFYLCLAREMKSLGVKELKHQQGKIYQGPNYAN